MKTPCRTPKDSATSPSSPVFSGDSYGLFMGAQDVVRHIARLAVLRLLSWREALVVGAVLVGFGRNLELLEELVQNNAALGARGDTKGARQKWLFYLLEQHLLRP